MSIYDALGQERGIAAAVDDFYGRVLSDPEVSHHFVDTDMERLRRHQTALLVQVTGGPAQYSGRTLDVVHQPLGITGPEFEAVVGHLGATLEALGVDGGTIGEVAGALTAHRDEIVRRSTPVPT